MKTPDEIKLGLKQCTSDESCDFCPYRNVDGRCDDELRADAIKYIKQLEERNKKAESAIKCLMTEAFGSPCDFCVYVDDYEAGCRKTPGSGSWCCENARWNGEEAALLKREKEEKQ